MKNYILNDYKANYKYRKQLLKSFGNKGTKFSFPENSFIEFEYKKLDYIYLILNGRIKQYFIDYEGQEKTILILSKGDIFGEITMFQEDYDLVITETIEPTIVTKINKDTFYKVLNENPILYNELLLMITTKFRILMAQIHDTVFLNVKEKLYFLLKRLSIQQGIKTNMGARINMKLTHQELANMIGASRSTVTKILNELEKEKKIKRSGKYIYIL